MATALTPRGFGLFKLTYIAYTYWLYPPHLMYMFIKGTWIYHSYSLYWKSDTALVSLAVKSRQENCGTRAATSDQVKPILQEQNNGTLSFWVLSLRTNKRPTIAACRILNPNCLSSLFHCRTLVVEVVATTYQRFNSTTITTTSTTWETINSSTTMDNGNKVIMRQTWTLRMRAQVGLRVLDLQG